MTYFRIYHSFRGHLLHLHNYYSKSTLALTRAKVGEPYNDFKHYFSQYILSTWQDDWSSAVTKKLHSVKPVLGDWQSSYRRCGMEGWKEMFYLTTHSTHFIYGYMMSDIWLRTTQIAREETSCRHMCYSFRLTAWVLLYAPSHRQDTGTLAGTRNSSMGLFLDYLSLAIDLERSKCFI